MNLTNLNIFSVFSLITMFLSSGYLVYGLVVLPLRKATTSFAILSSIVFLTSLGSFISLTVTNFHTISAGLYIEMTGIILSSISLLNFTLDSFETSLIKIKKKNQYLLYLLPFSLIILIFFTGGLHLHSSQYGFMVDINQSLRYIIIPYLAIGIFIIILIIIFQIYKDNRFNRTSTDAIILLIGFCFYFLSSLIYQILSNVFNLIPAIPLNSILLFFLYITISVSLLSSKIIFENTSLKEAIKNSEDCIMIIDPYGNIIEINEHTYKTLYGKNLPKVKVKLESDKIKSIMNEIIADKIKAKELFDYLSNPSTKVFKIDIDCFSGNEKNSFNVVISPIFDRSKKISGKLAIFRDISENQRLQLKLKKEAIRDFLTGAYNRRFFYESLLMEINRYKRFASPFCLMIIDIDKFKHVNDAEGHQKGDYVLIEAVKILKNNIRSNLDIVSRYGGDEFAVILANTSLAETEDIARRILSQYQDMHLSNTTLSIGICSYKDNMETEEIIKMADLAMYDAKSKGGNNLSFSK
jgi:diguanylate cyclase (GGDEF)-like protein